MKNIRGRYCANCYNCRCKSGRAWCSKELWLGSSGMKIANVDVRNLSAKYYRVKAKECPDYERDKE